MTKDKVLMDNFDKKTIELIRFKGYEVKNKLGSGAFGVVFRAKAIKTDEQIAIKVLNLNKMSASSKDTFMKREIKTLIKAIHPNLICVYDIFQCNEMYFFIEFAANGDITGFIKKHNGIKANLACQWFLHVSKGLQFMHNQMNTVHRDIKTDNMLLDDKFIAKLSDFGFAKECIDPKGNKVLKSDTFCGTLPFESVQILEHKQYNPFKSDIWSMGVTFFVMFHSKFPFSYKKGRKQMIKHMHEHPAYIRGRYKAKLPHEANQLVESMLHPNEEKRASVNDLVNNPWLGASI